MSLKDKLEIGLKPDAAYRPDNLPDFQADDPACREAGQSSEAKQAREECDEAPAPRRVKPKLKSRHAAVIRAAAPHPAAARGAGKARAAARSRKAASRKSR
jgi:hypothetical protein